MTYHRYAFFFAVCMLVSAPATAGSATFLQFGSFESRSEAEARLNQVKQKNAALIGAMDVTIREVKLPPDNITVYRTQAGPVASKTSAQSICSQLAAQGDECYVVQTAMVDVPASTSAALAATGEALGAPVAAKTVDSLTAKLPNPDATLNADLARPFSAQASARDPRAVTALASVGAGTTTLATPGEVPLAQPSLAPLAGADAAVAAPATNASPQLQAALDQAVVDEAALKQAVAPPPASEPSFWSRLNPFSSATPKATPAADVAALAPPQSPIATPAVTIEAPAAVASVPLAPLQPTESTAVAAEPVTLAAASLSAPPLQLPPPPAPLKGFNTADAAAPTPESTGNIAARPLPAGPGSVKVEEAKRVPLTQNTLPSAGTAQSASALSLSPSATLGQKTLWAQIGPFADTQEALAFWEQYRQLHPDFPVVRVRVTASLLAQWRGNTKQWLRVGPFAREGFISSLCASLADSQDEALRENTKCGRVIDLGVASSGTRQIGYLPGSRYNR